MRSQLKLGSASKYLSDIFKLHPHSGAMRANILENDLLVHLLLLSGKIIEGSTAVVLGFVLSSGVHVLVVILCSQVIGLAALSGITFSSEGTKKLPLNKFSVLARLFLIGILSTGAELLFFQGLIYTSPDFVSVFSCLIPIVASVIAIAFRVESVHWWRYDGQAKLAGIIVACSGAALMSVYKGHRVLNYSSTNASHWLPGALMIFLGCFAAGILINIQTPLLREYQAPWSVLLGTTTVAAITTGISCFFLLETWSLPSTNALLGILYYGVVGVPTMGALAWILTRRSLLLICCYSAVQPVATIVLSVIFLRSTIYMGSILGALVVISGVVLSGWSEAETKRITSMNDLTFPIYSNKPIDDN